MFHFLKERLIEISPKTEEDVFDENKEYDDSEIDAINKKILECKKYLVVNDSSLSKENRKEALRQLN